MSVQHCGISICIRQRWAIMRMKALLLKSEPPEVVNGMRRVLYVA